MLRFRLHFLPDMPKLGTSNFRKVVRQHAEGGGKYYMSFVGNLLGFRAVKEFWKSVKNCDKVIAMSLVYYFFGDTVYTCKIRRIKKTVGQLCIVRWRRGARTLDSLDDDDDDNDSWSRGGWTFCEQFVTYAWQMRRHGTNYNRLRATKMARLGTLYCGALR